MRLWLLPLFVFWGACSLGEVVRQEQQTPEYLVVRNLSYKKAGTSNAATVSESVRYDGALLTDKPFSLSLRFDDYDRYFYPDGHGRDSPVGTYQAVWKIFAPDGTKNLLLSPLASFTGVKVDHHFVALQRNLAARTSKDLPTDAVLYLKIRSPGPPYLPEGDYKVEAEVTDGEQGNPKILHQFSRELKVVTPLRWHNGDKLFFRVHLDTKTFATGDDEEQSAAGINDVVAHTVDPQKVAVHHFVTVWGWRLEDQRVRTLKLGKANPPSAGMNFVDLSTLPTSSPPASGANSSHLAESTAMTVLFNPSNPVIESSLSLLDDYGQIAQVKFRLKLG